MAALIVAKFAQAMRIFLDLLMNKHDELEALSKLTADRTNRDQTLGGIIAKAASLVAADAPVGTVFICAPTKPGQSKLIEAGLQRLKGVETLLP